MDGGAARIWVLLTDGVTARICSTEDGMAAPILVPQLSLVEDGDSADAEREARAYSVWFRADAQAHFPVSPKRRIALHLAQLLDEGARDGAFDGLIVIASPQIRTLLHQALSAETRSRLLGKIVCDLPTFDEVDPRLTSELRH